MKLSDVMDHRQWAVGVVVPARNEESSITPCVESIVQALNASEGLTGAWVVVVADSCSDRTVKRARTALGSRGAVLECAAQSPGSARRIGAQAILDRFSSHPSNRLWIANTDADSSVSPDWLTYQITLAAQGYCAVAGIVRVDSIANLDPRKVRELMGDYLVNPDGSHPHVHGANLGIRGDTYIDVGGWKTVALAEDHCLWRRVKARNWSAISSAASVVTTSGRLSGRAIGGFADRLRRRIGAFNA